MSLLDLLTDQHVKVLRPSGGCHNCPRRRVDFVPATLNAGPVLWLGEAPGETEVAKQEGFIGRSGEKLRSHAHEAGVPEPWSFSNTIHCRPPENAKPKEKEISCCLSQFVLDEVRSYPWVVLCGLVPLNALFPGAQGAKFRGNVAHHPDFPGQRFYAINHPAFILRRPDKEDEFARHMQRLSRLVRGGKGTDWTLLRPDHPDFWVYLDAAMQSPIISWDVETTKKESWEPDARITSHALTMDGKTALYVHESEPAFFMVEEKIKLFLANPSKIVVGANLGFDLVFLEAAHEDYWVRAQIYDVLTLYYEMGLYKQPSLKELAAAEGDGYLYLMLFGHHIPEIEPWYNAEDSIHAWRLFFKGMQKASAKTRDLVVRVSGQTGYVLRRISQNGIYMRQDYRQQKIDEYRERRAAVVAAWKAEDPTFIPSYHESGDGLHEYLFKIRQLPIETRTDKGEPSTDRMTLKRWIQGGASYLRHLVQLREIDKLESTYLTAYDKHVGMDSRVHSLFTNTFTDTGRPSSREPNLQNISKKKEIRNLFGATPGWVMGDSDLSQIEFRIMVCLAQDRNGIAGYLRGDDAHTMTASSFTSVVTEEQRGKAKAINFALLYGGDYYNVQRVAFDWYEQDWPDEDCKTFVKGFFGLYQQMKTFHAHCRDKLVYNRGWFESILGHCFHYKDWDSTDRGMQDHVFRSALNSEAQGPAAQICFAIAGRAHRLCVERKIPVRFVNTVHDSLLWESPTRETFAQVVLTLEDARAQVHEWIKPWFVVPLVMDHKIGESWGATQKYAA